MQIPQVNIKVLVLLVSLGVLSACGGGKPDETATPTQLSAEEIAANAISTFSSSLTQTALSLPTNTPLPTGTSVPTFPVGTNTASSGSSPVPTTSCYRLVYIKDVTIPDNTPMSPGEAFTKTWLVQNTGSCAWEVGFRFNVIAGNPMNGVALELQQQVAPGGQYELSVPLVVPTNASGTLNATWRMADASGTFFGDALTVVINVSGTAPTLTATATATSTSTPTETPTP